jgi:hypothetical protein
MPDRPATTAEILQGLIDVFASKQKPAKSPEGVKPNGPEVSSPLATKNMSAEDKTTSVESPEREKTSQIQGR